MLPLRSYGASSLGPMVSQGSTHLVLLECLGPPSASLLNSRSRCQIIGEKVFSEWERIRHSDAESWHTSSFNKLFRVVLRDSHVRGGHVCHFRPWRGSANIHQACRCFSSSLGQPIGHSDDPITKKVQHIENGALTSASGEDYTIRAEEFSETLRLVETAMLAAAIGLAYFLSTLLRIENYFGCFFPLPLVISSLRWGVAAGRKTMVATAMLLLVLSGPLKVASYVLMHGLVGLAMGTLWSSGISWGASVFLCTLVRSAGAMGSVFLSSWLLRDNILALIMINAHASISYMLAAMGINIVPSMGSIYFIFGTLVLLNSGSFVFLLHVLYALFLRRLGLNPSLIFPAWLKTL